MSDAGESGDIKESFVEDENKIDIEPTEVNLGCVKNEPNEEALDFEEDSQARQYRITLESENIFGKPSHQLKIEEDYDNLIGFLDNDVIMENAMVKLEAIKEEDDGSFNNFHCRKCKGIYKGFCLKCSTLLQILNNNWAFVKSEFQSNTVPTDILEIRGTSGENGVYLLRTLPINVIFGPFEGILGIESTVGYSWKVIDNKLKNIKFGNWMKNIACATSALLKNLDIFQIDGNLYFQTNREITEGEELFIYYDHGELQQLDNSEECFYTPQKQKLAKIFACTMCCLGFGSNKCLMEHKRKCFRMEHSRSVKDFVLIECHYCKMWMEKWEHEEQHVAYCLEKYHRMSNEYSEAVDRNDANVEEMDEGYCGTRDGKRRYRGGDIWSRPKDDLQFDTKDYQWFSGAKHETCVKECTLAEQSNKKRIQNEIESNNKSDLQKHLCDICMLKYNRKDSLKRHIKNKHRDDANGKDYKCSECSFQTKYEASLRTHLNKHKGNKSFTCDICMMKFAQKHNLKRHIRYKHTDDGTVKEYKCLECFYQTNYKTNLQKHLNKHKGIKPFQCDICMKEFRQKVNLNTHTKNKHADDGGGKAYKCLECSYQTNGKRIFQRHLNRHREIKRFKCDICLKQYIKKSDLKMHIKNKHTDDGDVKDYQCLECSFQTNYKSALQRHLNKHRRIKQFQCDICMMKFTLKDSLKKHIRNKHTDDGGVKDYKCLECSYRTNYKNNFQTHLNKHADIKPFQCDICLMKFTQKGHLIKHIKNKHADGGSVKDYQCSECSYETNYKISFQTHLNKHRGIKPFKCDICMMQFSRKDSLKTHIKNKHKDDRGGKD